jgi:hypothetical protein
VVTAGVDELVAQGFAPLLLDEALAGVAGGEVDDFAALEEVFCQLFSACERAHHVCRADQWIRVGKAIRRWAPTSAAATRGSCRSTS